MHHNTRTLYAPLLLLATICLSFVCCEPTTYAADGSPNPVNRQNTLLADVDRDSRHDADAGDASNFDKRVERYAFGLGRRAYTYTSGGSGMKRLPVYNFGLGKRARPYSFGLGKRAEYDDVQYDGDFDHSSNNNNNGYNNMAFMDEKRNRPYSFGLGKRDSIDDVDRRGYPNRYGFGLGRR